MQKKKSKISNQTQNGDTRSQQQNQEINENIDSKVKQFVSIIDDLPYATVLNHKNRIYFNKSVEKIIGYTNDEIENIDDWFDLLYNKDAEKVKEMYCENRGNNYNSEVVVDLTSKSGEVKKVAFKDKTSPIGEIWGLEDKTELINVKAENFRQNQEYHHLLDFMKIGFWEWYIESDNLVWNDNMYKIYGFGENKTVNSYDDYKDRLHPDDIDQMGRDLEHVLDSSVEDYNNNFRIILNDGNIKHLRAVAKIYRDKDDKAIKLVGLNWDITNEVELEQAKKELTERYKFILSSIKMGIWDWDLKSDKLILNDTMKEILGFEIGDICNSESLLDLLHPDDEDNMKTELYDAINSLDQGFDSIFRIILEDGTLKHIRSVAKFYRDEDGIAIRMVGLNWDITKDVEFEEESKDLAERYKFILDSINMGVWDWDIESDIMNWNDNMYSLYGFEINEKFSNMENFQAVLHPDDKKRVNNEVEYAISTPGIEFKSTFRILKQNNEVRYIQADSQSYRDEAGKAIRMVGLNKDITKEIEHQEESKKLAEKYDFILSPIGIGIWDWDIVTDKLNWNETMYEVFGYDKVKEVNHYDGFKEFLHPDDLERVDKEIDNAINTNGVEFNSDFRVLLDDGNVKHIRSVSKAYRDEDGKVVRMAGVSMNITKEIELEEESKELSEKYELILNNTKVGVWDWDIKKNKITRSKTILELFEVPEDKDDSFESTFGRFTDRVHPEDLDKLQTDMEKIQSGKIENFESEIRIVTTDGTIKYLKSIVNNEKNEEGNLLRIYGIFLDNTKIKESKIELQKAKDKAVAANKSKSEFLANMSHEIRTPMNAIMGLTYLTLKTELDNKQKDYLTKIHKSSASLLEILNDILDFSKVEAGKLELEDIEFEIEDVLDSVSDIITDEAYNKGLMINFNMDQDVPKQIISDPLRIKQIILNLCSNALKFTERGEIKLEVEKVNESADQVELKVIITDTGIGMKEEQIKKLFQSFTQADSSTTRKYGGSGLGLTISKNFVELLGGEIGVESEYGKGSKFYFTFKCKPVADKSGSNQLPYEIIRGLKVLVCDDNKSSRNILRDYLNALSFKVTTTDNGYDALNEIKNEKNNPYDLVLLDWEMPGIDGIETKKEIDSLKLTKSPAVVIVTSHPKKEILEKEPDINFHRLLIKPITTSVLFDTIINIFNPKAGKEKIDPKRDINKNIEPNKLSGKKILLAEDNEINQLVAKELLTNEDMLVDIAYNGVEAIYMVNKKSYDLVLMDLHMPEKDGYDAALGIREKYSSEELPIIAMTADAMSGVKEKCLKVGMNGFITKPVKAERLYDVLSKWLLKKPNYEVSLDNNIKDKNLINGIDLKAGFDSVGGNKELYLKLLKKFKHSYQNFFDELLSIPESDSIQIERKIHTLKGVAGIIGAKTLYHIADKYMVLLKSDFVPNNNNMTDLKSELERVLKSASEYVDKATTNTPLETSTESFLSKLNELENLLKENDYDSIKVISEILNSKDYNSYEKEIKLIYNLVNDYDFEKAFIELNKIKTKQSE